MGEEEHERWERVLLRPWLENMLENRCIPGLDWYDPETKTMFKVPWKHRSKKDWSTRHCSVFLEWAKNTGRWSEGDPTPNFAQLKTRLRCAFNKARDIEEMREFHYHKGEEPFKVYRFCPRKDAPSISGSGKKFVQKTWVPMSVRRTAAGAAEENVMYDVCEEEYPPLPLDGEECYVRDEQFHSVSMEQPAVHLTEEQLQFVCSAAAAETISRASAGSNFGTVDVTSFNDKPSTGGFTSVIPLSVEQMTSGGSTDTSDSGSDSESPPVLKPRKQSSNVLAESCTGCTTEDTRCESINALADQCRAFTTPTTSTGSNSRKASKKAAKMQLSLTPESGAMDGDVSPSSSAVNLTPSPSGSKLYLLGMASLFVEAADRQKQDLAKTAEHDKFDNISCLVQKSLLDAGQQQMQQQLQQPQPQLQQLQQPPQLQRQSLFSETQQQLLQQLRLIQQSQLQQSQLQQQSLQQPLQLQQHQQLLQQQLSQQQQQLQQQSPQQQQQSPLKQEELQQQPSQLLQHQLPQSHLHHPQMQLRQQRHDERQYAAVLPNRVVTSINEPNSNTQSVTPNINTQSVTPNSNTQSVTPSMNTLIINTQSVAPSNNSCGRSTEAIDLTRQREDLPFYKAGSSDESYAEVVTDANSDNIIDLTLKAQTDEAAMDLTKRIAIGQIQPTRYQQSKTSVPDIIAVTKQSQYGDGRAAAAFTTPAVKDGCLLLEEEREQYKCKDQLLVVKAKQLLEKEERLLAWEKQLQTKQEALYWHERYLDMEISAKGINFSDVAAAVAKSTAQAGKGKDTPTMQEFISFPRTAESVPSSGFRSAGVNEQRKSTVLPVNGGFRIFNSPIRTILGLPAKNVSGGPRSPSVASLLRTRSFGQDKRVGMEVEGAGGGVGAPVESENFLSSVQSGGSSWIPSLTTHSPVALTGGWLQVNDNAALRTAPIEVQAPLPKTVVDIPRLRSLTLSQSHPSVTASALWSQNLQPQTGRTNFVSGGGSVTVSDTFHSNVPQQSVPMLSISQIQQLMKLHSSASASPSVSFSNNTVTSEVAEREVVTVVPAPPPVIIRSMPPSPSETTNASNDSPPGVALSIANAACENECESQPHLPRLAEDVNNCRPVGSVVPQQLVNGSVEQLSVSAPKHDAEDIGSKNEGVEEMYQISHKNDVPEKALESEGRSTTGSTCEGGLDAKIPEGENSAASVLSEECDAGPKSLNPFVQLQRLKDMPKGFTGSSSFEQWLREKTEQVCKQDVVGVRGVEKVATKHVATQPAAKVPVSPPPMRSRTPLRNMIKARARAQVNPMAPSVPTPSETGRLPTETDRLPLAKDSAFSKTSLGNDSKNCGEHFAAGIKDCSDAIVSEVNRCAEPMDNLAVSPQSCGKKRKADHASDLVEGRRRT